MNHIHDIFFQATSPIQKPYKELLHEIQEFCRINYTDAIVQNSSKETEALLKEIIYKYIQEHKYVVENFNVKELADRIYEDMAGYSFLKKWIYNEDIEEVNINAWNDIEVVYKGGKSVKIPDQFASPQHAVDVTRRMLSSCGMIIDDTMPSALGHLDKNIRISANKTPLVDSEVGISASIRKINQETISREKLIASGGASPEMLDFLTYCIHYGVSICIAGPTNSGKTTLMAWLLSTIPNNYRLITIEDGSREFNLVKRDTQGNILNSVIHLITRHSENPVLDIDQDFLLERVLRSHPHVIGIGEIRAAAEAMSVAEASRTGHTCITTIHANNAESSYRRMMTLAKRKYNMDDSILMQIMVEAYPIVVYVKQLEDGSRKIMEIIEGEQYEKGNVQYRTLYHYEIKNNNRTAADQIQIEGCHLKKECISKQLIKRLLDNGISQRELLSIQGDG